MRDSYYPVQIRLTSKNSWFTPQESNNYYTARYAREGITVHWWGDGTGADNHDNIVNYFLAQGEAGNKSVNYVLSDNKITLMVSPDNVAWCSQAGNPTTISIEFQPTLGTEGYKKGGWLIDQLEQRYSRTLSLYPHKKWFSTSCPGTLDINRLRAEANKWKAGGYDPAPAPVNTPKPTPEVVVAPAPTVGITYSVLPAPITYKVNKDTDLWNFNTATWAGFKSVKKLVKGEDYTVYAIADNHSVKAQYGVTKYSFDKKVTNGVNMKDLDLVQPAQPVPEPPKPVPPVPVPETVPTNVVVEFLTSIIKQITEFIAKITKRS
jgi:hypothetical protein